MPTGSSLRRSITHWRRLAPLLTGVNKRTILGRSLQTEQQEQEVRVNPMKEM
jgi:hypothetical protein